MAVHDRNNQAHQIVMSLAVPKEKVWQCFTNSSLVKQWYSQPPYQVVEADMDIRPGGRQVITVSGPDGKRLSTTEVILEVVSGEKLVFTDAFDRAWKPSSKATKVTEIKLDSVPTGTRISLCVSYWDKTDQESLDKHFEDGWKGAVDRIEGLCRAF